LHGTRQLPSAATSNKKWMRQKYFLRRYSPRETIPGIMRRSFPSDQNFGRPSVPSASDLARIGEILLKGILRLPPPAEPQEERVQPKPSRLPSREIDPLDNRILQSLAFFGDTSPGFLCEQTGASSATLRRRLRTLEE